MAQLPGGPAKVGDIEGSKPMPDAVYTFRIAKATIERKKNPAPGEEVHPYINIMLKCITEGEHFGRAVWDILTLKPQQQFKLRQLLEDGLGWDPDDELSDTDQLLNEEVEAAITTEAGQKGYAPRNKVVRYMKAGTSAPVEIAPA